MKAYEELQRIDRRRMRAMSVVSQVMHIVGKYIPHDAERNLERDLCHELQEAMEKFGAEIVSDFDRQAFGLPPRGPDGWTMEEIVELEKRRLEMMLAPIPPVIIVPRS